MVLFNPILLQIFPQPSIKLTVPNKAVLGFHDPMAFIGKVDKFGGNAAHL
jgi:hypothetical protein